MKSLLFAHLGKNWQSEHIKHFSQVCKLRNVLGKQAFDIYPKNVWQYTLQNFCLNQWLRCLRAHSAFSYFFARTSTYSVSSEGFSTEKFSIFTCYFEIFKVKNIFFRKIVAICAPKEQCAFITSTGFHNVKTAK